MPKLVLISDTHLWQPSDLPQGDILVHAGDMTMEGSLSEVASIATWLGNLPGYTHKVVVPGNHDWLFQRDQATARLLLQEKGIILLMNDAIELLGLRFYGSPDTPEFCNWAFNHPRGQELARIWSRIPTNTDVLVTHGPAKGTLDSVGRIADETYGVYAEENMTYEHVGCADLAARISQLKLKAHVFGHVHRPGIVQSPSGLVSINATLVNERYEMVYPARELTL